MTVRDQAAFARFVPSGRRVLRQWFRCCAREMVGESETSVLDRGCDSVSDSLDGSALIVIGL